MAKAEDRVVDPVCGMMLGGARRAARHREYGGVTYHFCSDGCAGKFDADADAYAAGAGQTGSWDETGELRRAIFGDSAGERAGDGGGLP